MNLLSGATNFWGADVVSPKYALAEDVFCFALYKTLKSFMFRSMSLYKQRQGQLGVNVVERILMADWQSRWQPLDAHNDDGVDGLIFLENGGELSGQIVFVQIKCTRIGLSQDEIFRVPIKRKQLARNLEAWKKVVGAAILILVDPETLVARWVNLKNDTSFTPTQVLVPDCQLFDRTAKQAIAKLCGTMYRDLQANKVHTIADDFLHLRSKKHLHLASRELYQSLQREAVQLGGNGPIVHFDREGWRHITRPKRSQLTRYQSFVLLGTARKIIEGASAELVFKNKITTESEELNIATVRAMVTFPFRQTGLVKLLVKKSSPKDGQAEKLKFWTIYEPRRKATITGVQEPRCP